MSEQFARILLALWSNDFSKAFTVLICAYFLFALLFINSANPKIKSLVSSAPGAMTSIGILGTFLGIFLGLLDFDIRLINKSVPLLLEGLKVAFGTSILGLFSAVLFRVVSPMLSRSTSGNIDATAQDIVDQISELHGTVGKATEISGTGFESLRNILSKEIGDQLGQLDTSVNKAADANITGFESIRSALSDDKDSSIVGQLQRLRTNVGDLESATKHGFEAQIKEFKEFAQHMSDAFSKAIIEELQAVIREFNEKISEQFGDNFKQLNTAVGRLVDWQDEYKEQMSEMKTAIDHSITAIKGSENSLEGIESSTSKIPEHLIQMEQANSLLNTQLEQMENALGGFAEMRDKAVNAFPEIEKNIDDITTNLSATIEHQTAVVKEIATNCESMVSLQTEASLSVVI